MLTCWQLAPVGEHQAGRQSLLTEGEGATGPCPGAQRGTHCACPNSGRSGHPLNPVPGSGLHTVEGVLPRHRTAVTNVPSITSTPVINVTVTATSTEHLPRAGQAPF